MTAGVGSRYVTNISRSGFQPADRVVKGRLHALLPDGLGCRVIRIKEVMFRFLDSDLIDAPPVVPGIEHPGLDAHPVQISRQFLRKSFI